MKGKYLITTDNWFFAPDGKQYRSVWGEVEIVSDAILGIKTNNKSANWFAKVGSEDNHVIIAGCQIHYACKSENKPDTSDIQEYTVTDNKIKHYERPTHIYIAESANTMPYDQDAIKAITTQMREMMDKEVSYSNPPKETSRRDSCYLLMNKLTCIIREVIEIEEEIKFAYKTDQLSSFKIAFATINEYLRGVVELIESDSMFDKRNEAKWVQNKITAMWHKVK